MKSKLSRNVAYLSATLAAGMTALGSTALAGDYLEVAPGIEIYYEVAGEGPPLVLVPGWTFTTKVFEHQFANFSRTHRVISFDPRSQGRSTVTLEGNNYTTQGADLAKLLDHLKVKNPVLLGWSFGCLTTWQYVRDHGTDGVRGHVCVDLSPTPMTGVDSDWGEGSVAEIAGFYQGVQSSKGHRDIIVWYADEVMIEQDLTPELTSWIVDQSLSTPPWAASAYLAAGMFSNYLEEAKKIDAEIPSLFVVANHWARTAKRYLAQHTPRSEVHSFGGHMMFWEYHGRFNRVLASFLTRAAQAARPAGVIARQEIAAPVVAAVAPAPAPVPAPAPAPAAVTQDDIAAAVRDALKVGSERVVAGLGRRDGFNGDPKVHIPLPANLAQVKPILDMVGMGGMLGDVELKLNRAAEAAMPEAKAIFWKAIADMSFADIGGIFNGADDSATRYFRSTMSGPLAEAMRPVVDQSLAQVGAIQAFNALTNKMSSNPLVPNVKTDLTQHVLRRSVDAVFLYLAREEAAIRNDSVKRTTELLQRVFGKQ